MLTSPREKNLTDQHLQQSESFYRNLIADALDGILLTDAKGSICFCSHSITKILGYDTEETLGKSVFEYAHPDDRELAATTFEEEVKMLPRVKYITIRLLKKNGDWVWCIVRGHNMFANPYVGRMVIYFYDDTLRKKAKEALIESEKRFRTQATILNNVTDVIVTTDLNRVVTSWNKVIEKLTGITEKEAIGKPSRNIIESDYSPYTHDQVAGIVLEHGIWRGELSFMGADGEKKYLLHTVSLLYNEEGEKIGLLGVGKDITDRITAQAKLQESELFYRNMISHSLDGIIMTDVQGQITYCGPSVTGISGYEPEHLLRRNIFEFVHPDDIPAAKEAFGFEINKRSVADYIHLRLKHANGKWTWCVVRGHNLLTNPIVNAIVIYFTDDSRRKKIEDKLKEREEYFRNIIQNLRQGVIVQNEKTEIIICNRSALDMLGVEEDKLLGTTAFNRQWNVIHEDGADFPRNTHPVSVAFETKKPVRDVVMGVYLPAKNDSVWLLVNAEPLLDGSGNLVNVICSFTDITEQKKLSQKLIEQEIQKQKQLTQATIDGQEKERQQIGKELHDNINQHLTTTRLYMEVAREKTSGEALEMINLSHKTLAEIINEIRHLSQSLVPPTLGDIGLIESVHDLCDSLRRAHTFTIDFFYRHFNEERLPDNLKLMLFRMIQEQVNNIIRHANALTIQIKLQSDAEYIILTIADNGKGFDPTSIKRGLGFSNINNRAALFDGTVEIDAAPGKGCALTVVIPLATEE